MFSPLFLFCFLQTKKDKKSVFLGEGNVSLACTSVSLAATFSSAVPDGHFPRANGETLSKKAQFVVSHLAGSTNGQSHVEKLNPACVFFFNHL